MLTDTSRKNSVLGVILFAALGIVALTGAQSADSPPSTSTVPEKRASSDTAKVATDEAAVDRQHLERIYNAVRSYYRDHKDLPDWLSDLVPKYLPDTNDLLSPVELRTGKSVLYGREDPKIHTSYIYEFNAGPAAEEFNKGRAVPLTCKQWKLMQLEKFGLVTPILRSHVDKPVLNVAYSGQIYETGLLWENDPRTAALIKQEPRLGPRPGQNSGQQLAVHVVDAVTGQRIPQALVSSAAGSEFGLLPPGEASTDEHGDVKVPLGEWTVNFLFLNASHEGYRPAGIDWNRNTSQENALPAEITLKLAPISKAESDSQ
jgi:hypothetical protein